MNTFLESVAGLFVALGFLLFFGPVLTVLSIGKARIKKPVEIDFGHLSLFARGGLAILGLILWLGVYIPLVAFVVNKVQLGRINSSISSLPVPSKAATITPTTLVQRAVIASPSTSSTEVSRIQAASAQNLVITEVMGNPCNNGEPRNEYVELYNISSTSVSLQGLWLTDGDAAKAIVPWARRMPVKDMGNNLAVDSTILPPLHYAVVLAPEYTVPNHKPYQPYLFPPGTVILTVAEGRFITDDQHGIEVTNRDTVVLYRGTADTIEEVISTYGSPQLSAYPLSIQDNGTDSIPFRSDKCWAAERIRVVNRDEPGLWREVENGTPGYGNYTPP